MIGDGKPLHSRWFLSWWIRRVNGLAWTLKRANYFLRDYADDLTRHAVCEYRRAEGTWPLEEGHPYREWADRRYAEGRADGR